MMNTDDKILGELCTKQQKELEEKKLVIWDLEEENRIYCERLNEMDALLQEKQNRIDDLERWCTHLQGIIDVNKDKRDKLEKKFGLLFRIASKM